MRAAKTAVYSPRTWLLRLLSPVLSTTSSDLGFFFILVGFFKVNNKLTLLDRWSFFLPQRQKLLCNFNPVFQSRMTGGSSFIFNTKGAGISYYIWKKMMAFLVFWTIFLILRKKLAFIILNFNFDFRSKTKQKNSDSVITSSVSLHL